MSYKTRERLCFWIDQTLTLSIAVLSIWFASRIGYGEAVRFTK